MVALQVRPFLHSKTFAGAKMYISDLYDDDLEISIKVLAKHERE